MTVETLWIMAVTGSALQALKHTAKAMPRRKGIIHYTQDEDLHDIINQVWCCLQAISKQHAAATSC